MFSTNAIIENSKLKEKIKLDYLASGAYFIRVTTQKNAKTSKIIINR